MYRHFQGGGTHRRWPGPCTAAAIIKGLAGESSNSTRRISAACSLVMPVLCWLEDREPVPGYFFTGLELTATEKDCPLFIPDT